MIRTIEICSLQADNSSNVTYNNSGHVRYHNQQDVYKHWLRRDEQQFNNSNLFLSKLELERHRYSSCSGSDLIWEKR